MTACRDVLDFLMDYLDGHLSPAQRAIFEEHLAVCNSCVAYLHNYQQTVKSAESLSAPDHGLQVPEELLQNIMSLSNKGSNL